VKQMADGVTRTGGGTNVTADDQAENLALEATFDTIAQSIMQSMYTGDGIAAELRAEMDEE
jgi:hypothetical protein